ncbi:MAG TPA: DMT family transporter [Steroidobacter sp.]|jgi:O-acetylserine/cysteine efflux transporter|nr:DMT family transporter [Steroidobacteraceae bacterium]HLS82515.1 DMT family transporter [Steroidobacter sp.]
MSIVSRTAASESFAGRDLALLIGVNLIWGLNLIAAKIGVAQFPPIFFTALRFGALALFLLPVLRLHRGEMKPLLAAAMLTGPAAFGLLFVGLYIAEDASTVAIATQMSVPFSTLLSVWLLGEVIRWRRTLGIVLAFMGMAIISFDPRVFTYWEGLALVVASCFVASLGLIYVKRLRGVQPLELQAWITVTGSPILLLLSLLLENGQWRALQNANWEGWTALVFTIVMSSLIAHTTWYYLVNRYPVTRLSPLTLLAPLFGVFFGVTLLKDQLTGRMLIGGAITLLGVFIVALRQKQLVDTGT